MHPGLWEPHYFWKATSKTGFFGDKLRGSTFLNFKGCSGSIMWTMSSLKKNKEKLLISCVHEKFSLSLTHTITIIFNTSCMLHQVSTHLILGSESASPTLWDPTNWFLSPGSSVQGILQARMLEWVAISFSKGSSWSRDWTRVSCIAGRFFTVWATILKYYYFTILQPRKLHFTIL